MLVERNIENFKKIEWLDKYMMGHKGFIAGGCFKNIFNNQKIKDIDIFFNNEVDFNDALNYFEKEIDSLGNKKYSLYYENTKVKAFKDKSNGLILELIRFKYGTPKEILDNFDFTIVKFAYYKEEKAKDLFDDSTSIEYKCLVDDKFFEHLFEKRLVIDNQITFPIGTFERMFKYGKYGYFPCRESKIKIVDAIKKDNSQMEISQSLYDGLD